VIPVIVVPEEETFQFGNIIVVKIQQFKSPMKLDPGMPFSFCSKNCPLAIPQSSFY
jgi:hypothetical protein